MPIAQSHPLARLINCGTAIPDPCRRRLKILNDGDVDRRYIVDLCAVLRIERLWTYCWIININVALVAVALCVR
jgi:hypothetical protein